MWKLLTGISLTLCTFVMADDAPPKPSVLVECSGRLRHGIVAIGGETTGTTITFNRIVWELRLRDDAAREFAEEHNKEPVIVIGTLRKIAGIEVKDRWIIDVRTLKNRDATTDKEGTRMTIQGTLRTKELRQGNSPEMTIHADGQVWPIDVSTDAEVHVNVESLVDQPVLLTGSLERATEEESDAPLVIRVKTLKRSGSRKGVRNQ